MIDDDNDDDDNDLDKKKEYKDLEIVNKSFQWPTEFVVMSALYFSLLFTLSIFGMFNNAYVTDAAMALTSKRLY